MEKRRKTPFSLGPGDFVEIWNQAVETLRAEYDDAADIPEGAVPAHFLRDSTSPGVVGSLTMTFVLKVFQAYDDRMATFLRDRKLVE